MASQWTSFTATPIFGKPALRFPASGSIGEIEIPLHITKLTAQDEGSQVTEITTGPIIEMSTNLGSGGMTLGYGANKLPKIVMEGFIDTPQTITTVVGGGAGGLFPAGSIFPSPFLLPGGGGTSETSNSGLTIDGYTVTYGEIIAAYFEGRTKSNFTGQWQQVSPRWFRDPYGRVYGDRTPSGPSSFIRIYDLTLQRIEAVPARTNFSMTLQV